MKDFSSDEMLSEKVILKNKKFNIIRKIRHDIRLIHLYK